MALFITVLRDEPSHSPSPAGFVYLRFFWTPAPFLFSSVWPYQPVAIAVLVYLQFTWGKRPSPTLRQSVPLVSLCWKPSPLQAHWGWLCHTCLLWHSDMTHISHCWGPSPLQALWGGPHPHLLLQAYLFTVGVGKYPSPTLRQSMPHGEAPLPLTPELRASFSLCYMSFFSIACLLFSFIFFVGCGSVCPVGYAGFSQGCVWENRMPFFFSHLWVCQAG
jgi:hypothetical protein